MCNNYNISVVFLLAQLVACTPAATDKLDWVVANNTDDSLRVSVRYPLDSTLMATPDQLAWVRQRWQGDSSAQHGLGYHARPLTRMVRHDGRWYFVYSSVAGLKGVQYDLTGTIRYARSNYAQGLLTYTLPPHGTQQLLEEGYVPAAGLPPYMLGLWLEQGSTCLVVFPGQSVDDVFRFKYTGREHGNNSLHRVQLTVGPSLTIND